MAKSAKPGRAPAPAMVDDPAKTNSIIVGKSTKYEVLDLHFANRHGLVAGATGIGKTVTLQVLAEGLSEAGVRSLPLTSKATFRGSPRRARRKMPWWRAPRAWDWSISLTNIR